jgi:hypothetical protein
MKMTVEYVARMKRDKNLLKFFDGKYERQRLVREA